MIYFSVGLPGRFAEWCDQLVARLVERRGGPVAAVALNDLEELAVAAIGTRASDIVACSRQPVLRLQSEIVRAGLPFVVTLGDPRIALRDQIEHRALSLVDATRSVASSCAMILTMAQARQALVVRPQADPRDSAAAVARHFGIAVSDAELSGLVAALPGAAAGPDAADAWLSELDARGQAIVAGALDPYIDYFADSGLRRLVWEPELFFINEEPAAPTPVPATRPVDLTGRPRFVVYGPFVNLPPGMWSAEIVLGFSAEAAGNSFGIEVFAGVQLAQSRLHVSGEQVSDVRLDFTLGEAISQPVQIRVVNERAAFDGRLAVGYVALTRRAAIPEETRARLASTLRRDAMPLTTE